MHLTHLANCWRNYNYDLRPRQSKPSCQIHGWSQYFAVTCNFSIFLGFSLTLITCLYWKCQREILYDLNWVFFPKEKTGETCCGHTVEDILLIYFLLFSLCTWGQELYIISVLMCNDICSSIRRWILHFKFYVQQSTKNQMNSRS